MRTTLILDDDLVREAKRRAADSGRTLSDVVTAALREALRAPEIPAPPRFRVLTFDGGGVASHEPADFARVEEQEDRARLRG